MQTQKASVGGGHRPGALWRSPERGHALGASSDLSPHPGHISASNRVGGAVTSKAMSQREADWLTLRKLLVQPQPRLRPR